MKTTFECWNTLTGSYFRTLKSNNQMKPEQNKGTIRIELHRNETSQPIVYENAENAYTKGVMYCIVVIKAGKRITHKYPVCSLFRVIEDYNPTYL